MVLPKAGNRNAKALPSAIPETLYDSLSKPRSQWQRIKIQIHILPSDLLILKVY